MGIDNTATPMGFSIGIEELTASELDLVGGGWPSWQDVGKAAIFVAVPAVGVGYGVYKFGEWNGYRNTRDC